VILGPAWNDDSDCPELGSNLRAVTLEVFEHAEAGRLPNRDLPREWHRRMLEGIDVPSDVYRGGYRGESHPHLHDYGVQVDGIQAVAPSKVASELRQLFTWLRNALPRLDVEHRKITARCDDWEDRQKRLDIEAIRLAAHLHGEWIRIHPFVNGNGRTARLWVLWVTSRYGLPPLLVIRPRPGAPYGAVSRASLAAGDHAPMEVLLLQQYSRQSASTNS
jgi:hypothetical protein